MEGKSVLSTIACQAARFVLRKLVFVTPLIVTFVTAEIYHFSKNVPVGPRPLDVLVDKTTSLFNECRDAVCWTTAVVNSLLIDKTYDLCRAVVSKIAKCAMDPFSFTREKSIETGAEEPVGQLQIIKLAEVHTFKLSRNNLIGGALYFLVASYFPKLFKYICAPGLLVLIWMLMCKTTHSLKRRTAAPYNGEIDKNIAVYEHVVDPPPHLGELLIPQIDARYRVLKSAFVNGKVTLEYVSDVLLKELLIPRAITDGVPLDVNYQRMQEITYNVEVDVINRKDFMAGADVVNSTIRVAMAVVKNNRREKLF